MGTFHSNYIELATFSLWSKPFYCHFNNKLCLFLDFNVFRHFWITLYPACPQEPRIVLQQPPRWHKVKWSRNWIRVVFKVVGGNTGLIHARLYPSKLWSAALRGLTEEGCLDHNFDCFTEFCSEMFFLCPPDETWINNLSLANYLVLTRAGCAKGTLSLFKVLSGVS